MIRLHEEARSSILVYISDRFLIESQMLTSSELLEFLEKKSLHESSVMRLSKNFTRMGNDHLRGR
jgi:hypothetical protein